MNSSKNMNKKDKGIAMQTADQCAPIYPQSLSFYKNVPLDPLLFYIRDHELYYTALQGPRHNEYAIFNDYHEWYLSANMSFYQYLKIILAYRALLRAINRRPVLIILPTGYIESWRFFHHFHYGENNFTYWKHYKHCVLRFVQRIIPDVHICPQDFLSYQTRFFSTLSQLYCCIQNTCLQMSHCDPNCSCHQPSHYDLNCNILLHYANSILEEQGDSDDDGKSLAIGKIQGHNEKTLQGTNDPWQK